MRRRRRERRFRGRAFVAALLIVPVLVLAALVGAVTVAAFEYERFRTGCELADHRPHPIGRSSFVYAADDSFLGTIPSTVNRQLVEGSRMSPWSKRATVARVVINHEPD